MHQQELPWWCYHNTVPPPPSLFSSVGDLCCQLSLDHALWRKAANRDRQDQHTGNYKQLQAGWNSLFIQVHFEVYEVTEKYFDQGKLLLSLSLAENVYICFVFYAFVYVSLYVYMHERPGVYFLQVCSPCNATCVGGCRGPRSSDCVSCRNVSRQTNNVTTCVDSCRPTDEYVDSQKRCQPCHAQCESSCTGGGPTACNACKGVSITRAPNQRECLSSCAAAKPAAVKIANTQTCVANCPGGRYLFEDEDTGDKECRLCHPQCVNCTAFGKRRQQDCAGVCRNVDQGGQCEAECSAGSSPDGENICVKVVEPTEPQAQASSSDK